MAMILDVEQGTSIVIFILYTHVSCIKCINEYKIERNDGIPMVTETSTTPYQALDAFFLLSHQDQFKC